MADSVVPQPEAVAAPAPLPTLSEAYNAAPAYLLAEATVARDRIAANRTLPTRHPRTGGLHPPPGMTVDAFLTAVDELRAELGGDHSLVQVNDAGVDLVDGWYLDRPATTHDAFHIAAPEALVSSAVVFPRSTADVQVVVRWANRHVVHDNNDNGNDREREGDGRHGIPLYPISMGRNLGYGGAAPRVPGGVVLDLGRRMHAIVDLDGANASCVVEPGVTYFALYDAVQALNREMQRQNKATPPLWIDTPDLGGGSVLGNAVDRGVGYTPYGDHFAHHCGLEVVLPDGSLLRTGMGALPGPDGTDNPAWQAFQHSFGPAIDGLFSQSSLGIVTRMGVHLMPAPPAHQSYCLTFPRDDDFAAIVEAIRPLAQQGVLGNVPQLRHVVQELSAAHARHGFDLFPTLCVAGREMHYIANIVYDRADGDAKRRAVALMRELIGACAARGFGEYRTHLLFADQVARTYSWGGQALLRFHETIKDALDPRGVLAPGRNGVWPRAYRGRGWELGADDVVLDVIGPRLAADKKA
ncbi:FAD-binding, type 2 [Niveomyces insectorum RCEF 264]|uniref:FAD-binding, type 2 n=1 Tax=Niveomyces insectorum RCEF 264 TaxID=1081102 RepID=A0A167SFG4_9HYPO|nr:FAD-binding, type 2 [Niveomyces insectorum RCEF 264]